MGGVELGTGFVLTVVVSPQGPIRQGRGLWFFCGNDWGEAIEERYASVDDDRVEK